MKKKAFTLVELLVVIAIIALLAGVVKEGIPKITKLLRTAAGASSSTEIVNRVNDYTGTLSASQKESLEAKLKQHEQETSNQVVILMIGSLNGETIEDLAVRKFKEAKLGQKGKDNGILILLAMDEHKLKIEVGYGLEGILPDGKCGRIRDAYAIPNFKQGDYPKGIEQTVNAIVEALGISTHQERAEQRAQQKAQQEAARVHEEAARKVAAQKAAEKRDVAIVGLMIVFSVIAFLVGLFFILRKIIRAISEWNRKRELRERLEAEIATKLGLLDGLKVKLTSAETKSKAFPKWALEIAEDSIKSARGFQTAIRDALDLAEKNLSKNPDSSKTLVGRVDSYFTSFGELLEKVNKEVPELIQSYKDAAPRKLEKALGEFNILVQEISAAKTKGFNLAKFEQDKEDQRILLGEFSREIKGEHVNFKYIYDSASQVSKNILETRNNLAKLLKAKEDNEKVLENLSQNVSKIKGRVKQHEDILGRIKTNCPEDNWKDISAGFLFVPALILAAERFLTSAKERNSMENQDFGGSSTDLEMAEKKLTDAENNLRSVAERNLEVTQAKTDYDKKLRDATKAVQQAAEDVNDSDVEESTKQKAISAKSKLEKAKILAAAGGLVNWLMIVLLLSSVIGLSNEASESAKNEIEAVEDARRRKREQEEEEEAAERRRRNSYNSSDSWSSPSHSSESHSSSISFGGGHFGGGGCGGSW